jgi:hypothetical protein
MYNNSPVVQGIRKAAEYEHARQWNLKHPKEAAESEEAFKKFLVAAFLIGVTIGPPIYGIYALCQDELIQKIIGAVILGIWGLIAGGISIYLCNQYCNKDNQSSLGASTNTLYGAAPIHENENSQSSTPRLTV